MLPQVTPGIAQNIFSDIKLIVASALDLYRRKQIQNIYATLHGRTLINIESIAMAF
jgi:hypothetical protein